MRKIKHYTVRHKCNNRRLAALFRKRITLCVHLVFENAFSCWILVLFFVLSVLMLVHMRACVCFGSCTITSPLNEANEIKKKKKKVMMVFMKIFSQTFFLTG